MYSCRQLPNFSKQLWCTGLVLIGFLLTVSSSFGAESAAAGRAVHDKWALVVGVGKFADGSLNLKCPAKDASDFAKYLTESGNFAGEHVKLLLDENATRERILAELGDKWLLRVAEPDDLVVVYKFFYDI